MFLQERDGIAVLLMGYGECLYLASFPSHLVSSALGVHIQDKKQIVSPACHSHILHTHRKLYVDAHIIMTFLS